MTELELKQLLSKITRPDETARTLTVSDNGIGMDKDEVIAISRKIETFDISIQPYEDCCTVFTPKHPRTHPTIAGIEKAERGTEWDEPIKRAVEGTKVTVIKAFSKGD